MRDLRNGVLRKPRQGAKGHAIKRDTHVTLRNAALSELVHDVVDWSPAPKGAGVDDGKRRFAQRYCIMKLYGVDHGRFVDLRWRCQSNCTIDRLQNNVACK